MKTNIFLWRILLSLVYETCYANVIDNNEQFLVSNTEYNSISNYKREISPEKSERKLIDDSREFTDSENEPFKNYETNNLNLNPYSTLMDEFDHKKDSSLMGNPSPITDTFNKETYQVPLYTDSEKSNIDLLKKYGKYKPTILENKKLTPSNQDKTIVSNTLSDIKPVADKPVGFLQSIKNKLFHKTDTDKVETKIENKNGDIKNDKATVDDVNNEFENFNGNKEYVDLMENIILNENVNLDETINPNEENYPNNKKFFDNIVKRNSESNDLKKSPILKDFTENDIRFMKNIIDSLIDYKKSNADKIDLNIIDVKPITNNNVKKSNSEKVIKCNKPCDNMDKESSKWENITLHINLEIGNSSSAQETELDANKLIGNSAFDGMDINMALKNNEPREILPRNNYVTLKDAIKDNTNNDNAIKGSANKDSANKNSANKDSANMNSSIKDCVIKNKDLTSNDIDMSYLTELLQEKSKDLISNNILTRASRDLLNSPEAYDNFKNNNNDNSDLKNSLAEQHSEYDINDNDFNTEQEKSKKDVENKFSELNDDKLLKEDESNLQSEHNCKHIRNTFDNEVIKLDDPSNEFSSNLDENLEIQNNYLPKYTGKLNLENLAPQKTFFKFLTIPEHEIEPLYQDFTQHRTRELNDDIKREKDSDENIENKADLRGFKKKHKKKKKKGKIMKWLDSKEFETFDDSDHPKNKENQKLFKVDKLKHTPLSENNEFSEIGEYNGQLNLNQEESITNFIKDLNSPPQIFNFDVDKYLTNNENQVQAETPSIDVEDVDPQKTFYEFSPNSMDSSETSPNELKQIEQNTKRDYKKRDLLREYIKGVSAVNKQNPNYLLDTLSNDEQSAKNMAKDSDPLLNSFPVEYENDNLNNNLNRMTKNDDVMDYNTKNLLEGTNAYQGNFGQYFTDNLINKYVQTANAPKIKENVENDDFIDKYYLLNDGTADYKPFKAPSSANDYRAIKYDPKSLDIDLDLDKKFRELYGDMESRNYNDFKFMTRKKQTRK